MRKFEELLVNLSTCKHINLSTYQLINLSTYQLINLSTCKHINLSTSPAHDECLKMLRVLSSKHLTPQPLNLSTFQPLNLRLEIEQTIYKFVFIKNQEVFHFFAYADKLHRYFKLVGNS